MPPPTEFLRVEEILPVSIDRNIYEQYEGKDDFEEEFGVNCTPSPAASYTSTHSFEEKFVTTFEEPDTNSEQYFIKIRQTTPTVIQEQENQNQTKFTFIKPRESSVKGHPLPPSLMASRTGPKLGTTKNNKSSQICPFIPRCGVSVVRNDAIRMHAHFRRYHAGLKMCYICNVCGVGFTGYDNMMSHQERCEDRSVDESNSNNWNQKRSNKIQVTDVCWDQDTEDTNAEYDEDEEILANLSESNAKIANSSFPIVSLHRLKGSIMQRYSNDYIPESTVEMKRKSLINTVYKRTKTKSGIRSPSIYGVRSESKKMCSVRMSDLMGTDAKQAPPKRKPSDESILLNKCPKEGCNFRFKPTEEHRRQAHFRRIHEGIKKCFVCDICQTSFQYLKNWQSHTTEHTGVPIFVCGYCQIDCRNPAALKLHTVKVHEPEKLKFKCVHCGKVFAFQFKLNDHMRCHKKERPYMCEICSATFRFAHDLKRHQMKHDEIIEGEGVKCDICEKDLANPRSLSLHITKIHSKSCDLKCTICEYGANSKSELKRHVQAKHSDERNLKCHLCPSSFKVKSSLLIHLRRHADDRKYKCKTCGVAFVEKTGLNRHELIHTNAQSHVCKICCKTFPIKNYLHLHMRRHNKHIKHPTMAYRKKVAVIPLLDVTSEFDKANQMHTMLTKTNNDCEEGLSSRGDPIPITNELSSCHGDVLLETSLLAESNVFQDLT